MMTRFAGRLVGTDSLGNRYYESRCIREGKRAKRWVLYAAEPEASLVPPAWFSWLHYQSDQPLPNGGEKSYPWLQPHHPNLTGSVAAFLPEGHILCNLGKSSSVCDQRAYRPWKPAD